MTGGGIILCSNIAAVADQPAVQLPAGGRYVLVVEATTYPTTLQFQVQSQSGKWVPCGAATTADGAVAVDVPAGQCRMHLTGGSVSALYAALVRVPY